MGQWNGMNIMMLIGRVLFSPRITMVELLFDLLFFLLKHMLLSLELFLFVFDFIKLAMHSFDFMFKLFLCLLLIM